MNRKLEILTITLDCILGDYLLNDKEFLTEKESALIYEDGLLLAVNILQDFPNFLSEEPDRVALHYCISNILVTLQTNDIPQSEKEANADRYTISIVNSLCEILPRIQDRQSVK